MYIWILLATIMVAFSFYNISPRADKENYINEAKTSIIVNRFKMAHAFLPLCYFPKIPLPVRGISADCLMSIITVLIRT